MLNSCAILIPVYKEQLDGDESFALKISLLNVKDLPILLLAPNSLDLSYYQGAFNLYKSIRFDDKYFTSVKNYNRLLLSKEFYNSISDFNYVLILQTDAIVLKPELDYWLNRPYDYIGAPWKNGYQIPEEFFDQLNNPKLISCRTYVGNGGLSLRKIRKNLELLVEFEREADFWRETGSSEDLFFSCFGQLSKDFIMPNIVTAAHFAQEMDSNVMMNLTSGEIPFGVHAWAKYNKKYWEEIFVTMNLM
jgi:hypothetical protein